jgi:hypothetical protein
MTSALTRHRQFVHVAGRPDLAKKSEHPNVHYDSGYRDKTNDYGSSRPS